MQVASFNVSKEACPSLRNRNVLMFVRVGAVVPARLPLSHDLLSLLPVARAQRLANFRSV